MDELLRLAPMIALFIQPAIAFLHALAPVLRELRMILAIVLKSKPRRRK